MAYIQMVQHVLAREEDQHHLLGDQTLEKTFDRLMDDDLKRNDIASLEVSDTIPAVPFTSLNTHHESN